MAPSMEDFIYAQQQLKESMDKLLINFKKEGSDRRTLQSIKKRLSTLESYWQEFQTNHYHLNESLDKSDKYFTSNVYQESLACYEQTREFIGRYLSDVTEDKDQPGLRPTTPLGTAEKPSTPIIKTPLPSGSAGYVPPIPTSYQNRGSSSKTDDMLRKQSTNFRAFSRTIGNINLEKMADKWEFEDALKAIESRWSAIDSLHWDLDLELNGKNEENEMAFSKYELEYLNIKREINIKMSSMVHQKASTPKIELPTFGGSYHQWVSFKDLFVESIHKNPSLSSAQKLQYLKSKLKGEAEKIIQHLHITSENYQVCWDLLNNRYEHKKVIFTSHINLIMNLPVMQQQTAAQLKKIHDTTNESLNAIKNLGVDVSTWDPILVHILSQKLDPDTYKDYIQDEKNPRELPVLQEFLTYLETRFTSLETSKRKSEVPKTSQQQRQESSNPNKKPQFEQKRAYYSNINSRNCPLCKQNHGLFHCNKFLELSAESKKSTITKLDICKNCLYSHNGKACISEKRCRECNDNHNTIMHNIYCKNKTSSQVSTSKGSNTTQTQSVPTTTQSVSNNHVSSNNDNREVLLATAKINVQRADGTYVTLRALIDQGSQTSIISEKAAQLLGLPRYQCKGVITGVGTKNNHCKGIMIIKCASIHGEYELQTEVYIMKSLINNLPNQSFPRPTWSFLENIPLADDTYHISSPIDILFGAEVYAEIIQGGIIKMENCPIAQETRFGWILSGNVHKSFQCNVVINEIEDLRRFWTIESIKDEHNLSEEDQKCLEYYESTTERKEDGRFVVRLPLKSDLSEKLGESKPAAVAQFRQLQRRFAKQPNIKQEYESFINEYIKLDHMRKCDEIVANGCYLPHHPVLRTDSTTTALRVVFNASAKTSSGYSLNDLTCRGPNLQQDLFELILKWRQYEFVVIADIEKMFRQIMVHKDDQIYQKIIWTDENDQRKWREYQLLTVTYGTAAAPFLAMNTLKHLAKIEGNNYQSSRAAKALEEDFYMDDLLTGEHTIEATKQLRSDLIQLLKSGGFNLRKWGSNKPEILNLPEENQDEQKLYQFRSPESTKTLGLMWHPLEDQFQLKYDKDEMPSKLTKRILLSNISKIFDPLGWYSPVTTKLKLLFQQVWISKTEWDEETSEEIKNEWIKIRNDLININHMKIPRWLSTNKEKELEIFGFCDASQKAISCVIYCKIKYKNQVRLVTGKAKIIAENKNISLPRLELCGAQLLSKLLIKTIKCLSDYKIDIHCWTDSTAVLGWLGGDPNKWKPFVANRVRQVTEIVPSDNWRYVKSADNPADCASRGISALQLSELSLWWNGPTWLASFDAEKEVKKPFYNTNEEIKTKQSNVTSKQNIHSTDTSIIDSLLSKYSSFTRVVRVLAWIVRMTHRDVASSYLSLNELKTAHDKIIKYIQETFHGGARLTSSHLRQKYWILGGNRTVKTTLRGCVRCRRHDPYKQQQIMADLPAARTNQSRPFYHCGVDFTGYVDVKYNKGRGAKTTKGYIAVFVCMATKAVHLELVSDLTAAAFLAALRRMAARRGAPGHIYSDNGTNFIGSNNILQKEFINIKETLSDEAFINELSSMQIQWHFNAPSYPSAGGLWESSVKSLKYHMKRVIGEQKLTFEEFSTILSQLEACLNSRPLCSLSEDDLDYLSPAHFLSCGPTLTIIETEKDLRTRWQLAQKIFDDVWKRWRSEYLSQLSIRCKWQQQQPNIKINDVVIINDANLPAGKWALGRVVALHPGKDNCVRVVTLKTKNGMIKRPIIKLSTILHASDEDKKSEKTSSIKTTKPRSSLTSILLSIFMILTLVSSAFGSYNNTALNSTKGFYFDKIANMQIIRDDWKIIVYYDMHPYWEGFVAVEKYFNYLMNTCERTKGATHDHCDLILTQLKLGYSELHYYDRKLLNQQFSARDLHRKKRGLINGVGYIAHQLFGVLDDDFAQQYKKDIDLLNMNNKHLALLYKNQTSVVESEYNLIKRMEQSINKQHSLIDSHLQKLESAASQLTAEVQQLELTNEFILSAIIANNMLSKLSSIQESLLDIITNVYNGKFNIHLLTPEQLQQQLNIISGQLQRDLSLPINNIQTDLWNIYHLLRIRTRMTKSYLIFEVRIPLVSREGFEAYQVIPIPHLVEQTSISIIPVSENLAINMQKDTYVPISDINSCFISDQTTYLCNIQGPIYKMITDNSLCIKEPGTNTCQTQSIPCKNMWRELHTPNTYLYFCCNVCSLRVICEDQISVTQISRVGIMSLGQGCIIKGEEFTIYSPQHQSSKIKVQPDIYIHEIAPINHVINISVPIPISLGTINETVALENIKEQIYQIKRESTEIDSISYHDMHHYTAIYLLVATGIILGAVCMWRRARGGLVLARAPAHPATTAEAGPRSLPAAAPLLNSVISASASVENIELSDVGIFKLLLIGIGGVIGATILLLTIYRLFLCCRNKRAANRLDKEKVMSEEKSEKPSNPQLTEIGFDNIACHKDNDTYISFNSPESEHFDNDKTVRISQNDSQKTKLTNVLDDAKVSLGNTEDSDC